VSTSTDQPHELIRTLDSIHKVLDGRYWSPDTLEEIADHLRRAGYQIRSPEEIAEETEQERISAEALHEIADMPGEDSYGFLRPSSEEGDVCEGWVGWAMGRRNDLLELHFAKGWVRFYPDEDVKRESND
jgi:hypothetical protein